MRLLTANHHITQELLATFIMFACICRDLPVTMDVVPLMGAPSERKTVRDVHQQATTEPW